MSVFELDQHFWILNKSPVSDAWWLLGKLIICSHKNAHLFYPTPSESKGQSCFLRIHSLKLFNALDNTHGISWSYKGTKYSTAEQVSFSQTDEAALSRRGFTATALPWGRPDVLKGKWNQQHYCPGPCCIPPPSPPRTNYILKRACKCLFLKLENSSALRCPFSIRELQSCTQRLLGFSPWTTCMIFLA